MIGGPASVPAAVHATNSTSRSSPKTEPGAFLAAPAAPPTLHADRSGRSTNATLARAKRGAELIRPRDCFRLDASVTDGQRPILKASASSPAGQPRPDCFAQLSRTKLECVRGGSVAAVRARGLNAASGAADSQRARAAAHRSGVGAHGVAAAERPPTRCVVSGSVSSRSLSLARRNKRETCICEQPSSAAISLCLRSRSRRMESARRSR